MNNRLLAYLRRLGLAQDATDEQARVMLRSLRGAQATISNLLDHDEADASAATCCDTAIRGLGYDPENPTELLPFEQQRAAAAPPATTTPPVAPSDPAPSRAAQTTPPPQTTTTEPTGPQQRGSDGASTDGGLERVQTLRQLAQDAGVPDEMLWTAINDGHSVARASGDFLAFVRQQRTGVSADLGAGAAPAAHTRNSLTGTTREALLAALMIGRGKLNDPTQAVRTYDRQSGEFSRAAVEPSDAASRAADEGYRLRGLSMVGFLQRALAIEGVRCESTVESVVHAMRSAPGTATASVMGVFTQMFGAVLLNAYDRTGDTTQGWTRDETNANFFAQERHRMGKMGALTKHAKGGTADMMDVGDVTAYAKIDRYTGRFAIDEMDLINDTFGALNSFTPQEMGASARQLRAKLIYALLMTNPVMEDGFNLFSAEHNNLVTGALSKTSLQALLTAINTQQERGENIDLTCEYVIAPEDKRFDLKELIRSATVVYAGGDANDKQPSYNALVDEGLKPVFDARLDNGVVDPGSETAVAGDTNAFYGATRGDGRTIEATYLRGSSQSPQIRGGMSHPGSGEWIMSWDVKQDIGANVIGYAGMAKCTGVAP